jgi:nucleoside-diphosphate-sugar epimerase
MVRHAPAGARLIHLSSLAAAGPCAAAPGLDETAVPRPVSAYGISKRAAEVLVLAEGERRPVTVVRAPILYGPWDRAFLPFFRAAAWGLVAIPRRGDMPFSLLHVSDLTALLLKLAERPAPGATLWHACDGGIHTWRSLGMAAAGDMGVRPRVLAAPPGSVQALCRLNGLLDRRRSRASFLNPDKWREIRQPGWLCDGTRARRELGFTPCRDLARGLAETLAWYRRRGWVRRPGSAVR